MLLKEITETKGSYVGVTPSKQSKDNIKKLLKELKVENPISRDKMHTTLIYSRKCINNFSPKGKLDPPIIAKPKSFKIFHTKEEKNALVLELDCQELHDRHNFIMDKYGATYDYPEYIPHITLSYDCGDFDAASVDFSKYVDTLKEIEIVDEYYEDLKLDWKSS